MTADELKFVEEKKAYVSENRLGLPVSSKISKNKINQIFRITKY